MPYTPHRPHTTRPGPHTTRPAPRTTSWQPVADWYDSLVSTQGHYYHQHVILPNAFRLLALNARSSLLDLACGQGVLARKLPQGVRYVGIDLAPDLLKQARRQALKNHTFLEGDITKSLPDPGFFSHAAIILALQNVADGAAVIHNARLHLQPAGRLLIVLNHPCFRILRQSQWYFDPATKQQCRSIARYMSPQEIPIQIADGTTWSFHVPLSTVMAWLQREGFVVETIEEWCSDKQSTGKAARWENRARQEFPLFMAIVARSSAAGQSDGSSAPKGGARAKAPQP